ncbi:MAG: glycosyltransferase [Gammaproteobacteria bacterium]|nr:glycosyltransferase [Gammaproteobacteria bacterium]NIR83478.1 glycosyltransferase [Gammaproteobacteria bacterium]NIR91400.1 glycosyltransferase [Gammaproteobacteria bacterium]NIU04640.1 glycosyltransferase [Gammaproteobacteria bacterium]NIV51682.1 glycosyltransferase [Gammaproteobacteria bacterium]
MGLYVQMHSMHGLLRGEDAELGRDEDTGGQIIYVLNLARALGRLEDVDRVDIVTRRIVDESYPGYSLPTEDLGQGVRIVRVECGPRRYIKKVDLWPYMDEFIGNCKRLIEKVGRPGILHSNYADSGYVCARLSRELGIPQVHTGHSLGKPKMERLGVTDENFDEFDRVYHFSARLEAEQLTIDNAAAIIVSTDVERYLQYSMYAIDTDDSRFHVVHPGVDLAQFHPQSREGKGPARERLQRMLDVSLDAPERPMILAMARLDFKKNLISLLKAYAYDPELCARANLILVTGRDGKMGKNEQLLMDEMTTLIAERRLERQVCIVRHIEYPAEAGEIYRLAASSGGVFVNPALHEPFGITIIEAAATGLPVVATNNGGPTEIVEACENGLLAEPRDTRQIADAVKRVLEDRRLWQRFSERGIERVREHYTWDATARSELAVFRHAIERWRAAHVAAPE